MKRLCFLVPTLSLAALSPASAAIVYSGLQNIPIPFTFNGVYLNVITGAATNTEPSDFMGSPTVNFDFGGVDISNGTNLRPVVNTTNQVFNIPVSMTINSGSTFAAGTNASTMHLGPAAGQFQVGSAGYMGFAMNPGGTGERYGWIQMVLNNDSGGGKIVQYAYESTAGTAIMAGAIPEPGAFSCLLLAVAGLFSRRRR